MQRRDVALQNGVPDTRVFDFARDGVGGGALGSVFARFANKSVRRGVVLFRFSDHGDPAAITRDEGYSLIPSPCCPSRLQVRFLPRSPKKSSDLVFRF